MIDFDRLRRTPDIEAANLAAYDATDTYLLDFATERRLLVGTVAVLGDRHGALTLGALSGGADHVLTHQDSIVHERALRNNAVSLDVDSESFDQLPLSLEAVRDARTVLMQLPRGLDALDELAATVAIGAHPETVLVAGGRVKHMTHAMNDVLLRYFDSVEPQRARRKSRVLVAEGPKRGAAVQWPKRQHHARFDVTLVAHGEVFGGTALDPGATTLLERIDDFPDAPSAIDLGCGNGILSVVLAKQRPSVQVLATDVSSAAVASAKLSSAENGVQDRVAVRRADGLEGIPDRSAPLILLNPPFHLGAAVHTGMAERLIEDAGRALAPGGELWCVWNSHLRYRPILERIGRTRQIARNPLFTVTATRA
ncbi:MAG TPA: tRNA (adenine(22)-N(1))-methyltransferase TrmK [Candidatus Agrococcus pullicola]|uniref:tRNA (Adenine(22)-N(1))-methyltransferase TrmK n=1 Tax=Candidatus Agrococcus pullicola TaxID=2838429 RepID=A0A9D2CAP3_9MICO|nr:tRNA (adenine(22)-N(1))-methyltransferase TrmK [Candidatus Agrococcus pullicola]